MSRHIFTIELDVDDAQVAEHNEIARGSRQGAPIGDDPSEWDERDLVLALTDELATAEIVDYRAVVSPAEAYRADREARR